jgi:hypothetical protein
VVATTELSPPSLYSGAWLIAILTDVTLFCLDFDTKTHKVQYAIISICSFLPARCLGHRSGRADEESEALLGHETENGGEQQVPSGYGGIQPSSPRLSDDSYSEQSEDDDDDDDDRALRKLQKQRLEEEGTWWGYLGGFLFLFPYVWPRDDRNTKGWMIVMAMSLTMERIVMVLIPRQLGIIADELATANSLGEIEMCPVPSTR